MSLLEGTECQLLLSVNYFRSIHDVKKDFFNHKFVRQQPIENHKSASHQKMNDDQDPFAAFGHDDDEDEDSLQEADSNIERARELVAQANRQDSSNGTSMDGSAPSTQNAVPVESGAVSMNEKKILVDDIDSIKPLQLAWAPPLYTGSIVLCSSLPVGGGRGYVATKDIPPGELVLLERPLLAWPEDESSSVDLEKIQAILHSKDANQVLTVMEDFYPSRALVNEAVGQGTASENTAQVEEMIQKYRETIQNEDLRLKTILKVAAAKGVSNSDGTALSELDVLRMLVALRYNSLETGIYPHVAMLNHADLPNCVKFRPNEDTGYSEVRTTRAVRAGEGLTISYIPRLLCHSSRRKHLWKQHRFDIGDLDQKSNIAHCELVNGAIPNANAEELMLNIETATAELEDQCRELAETPNENRQLTSDEMETAKALELASLELYTSACDQLGNDHHILLLPCLALHLEACDLVQRHVNLSKKQRMLLLKRLIITGRKLIKMQIRTLGPDYFDLAKVYLDVAQAMQGKLCRGLESSLLYVSHKSCA